MCVRAIQNILPFSLQAITKFESLINQIQKNSGDIEERLNMIQSVRLFKQPPPQPGCEVPEAKVAQMIFIGILLLIKINARHTLSFKGHFVTVSLTLWVENIME